MKSFRVRLGIVVVPLLVILLVATFSGCSKSTAPGADIAGGLFDKASCTIIKWKEGLTLMIWHEATTSVNNHGSSSTESSVYTLEGYAELEDGNRIEWDLETSDGKTAEFAIDNINYDLSEGSLFIISTINGEPTITQLNHDLSGVQTNRDSWIAFGKSDPDVANFIESLFNEQ